MSETFELQSGSDTLSEYQFHKHVSHHLFYPDCGVQAFARGKLPDGFDVVALNVGSLDGIDVAGSRSKRLTAGAANQTKQHGQRLERNKNLVNPAFPNPRCNRACNKAKCNLMLGASSMEEHQ
jgi:hypothetical protein